MKFIALPFKQNFCAGLASLVVISFPSVSLGVTVEQVSNPRQTNGGWVTDMADILSPNAEAQLNQMISNLEAKNGSEIAVVTVPETAPSTSPKQFATTLFNRWGIGKADQNNGVLVLISRRERRVEIETGYGLQAILPNTKVSDIIQQEITPKFKQGDYDGGTIAGAKSLVVALETSNQVAEAGIPWYLWTSAFGGGIVVLWLLLRCRKNKHSKSSSVSGNSSHQISDDSDYNDEIVSNNYIAISGDSNNNSDTSSSSNSNNSYDSSSSYGSSTSYDSSSSSSTTTSYDSSSSSSTTTSYDSSSTSSSYDSGSSYSSSSDFGGGSSGGDGGGGSW